MVNGVHHVCIKCAGRAVWEADIAFYRDVLGFPVKRIWTAGEKCGAMLDAGNCLLEIMSNGDGSALGVTRHVAFACDDIPGVLDRVREAGQPVTKEAQDIRLGDGLPARIGFCTGPAGEEIEFFQEL